MKTGEFPVISMSDGFAIAPVTFVRKHDFQPSVSETPDKEYDKFLSAREKVSSRCLQDTKLAAGETDSTRRDILAMYLALANDEVLHGSVKQKICAGMPASAALRLTGKEESEPLLSLESPYFRERAADIIEVCEMLAAEAEGGNPYSFDIPDGETILAGEDIPAALLTRPDKNIKGVLSSVGSSTSHLSILARSLGIPAGTANPADIRALRDGELLFLNTVAGSVRILKNKSDADNARESLAEFTSNKQLYAEFSLLPARLADNSAVSVSLSADVSRTLPAFGAADRADGIGLFRTEFLYMQKDTPPTGKELEDEFSAASLLVGENPVYIRSFDFSADKMPDFASTDLPDVRGKYLYDKLPDLFETELCAALSANKSGNIRLMMPMVRGVSDMLFYRDAVAAAAEKLRKEGRAVVMPQIGATIELPSALAVCDRLAEICDFFSVGTNDLTHYMFAADRRISDAFSAELQVSPSMLTAMEKIFRSAQKAGKPVSVCGEIVSDPEFVTMLIGLGYRSFSVVPGLLGRFKELLSRIDPAAAARAVEKCMSADTEYETREILYSARMKA